MRKIIKDLLSEDERIQVVGVAKNGKEALEKINVLSPEVVTLDVEMPVMNGLDTLKRILSTYGLPVIMLSSTTTDGATNTIHAMQLGAFDFVAKPSGGISLDLYKVKKELVEKVVQTRSANVKQLKSLIRSDKKQIKIPNRTMFNRTRSINKKLVLIGTSTGGPRALEKVLTKIPSDIEAPILVVQHMPKGFTKSLAERLNGSSAIHVKEAENGEVLNNGVAYIAPGGYHLLIRQIGKTLVAELSESPPVKGHRPSVDQLFQSASLLKNIKRVAVIMTGMGSDGSEGLKELKQSRDIFAIAESEKTAVIFGMPKSAINTGVVDTIVDLDEIADLITNIVNKG
jgi:two-component system, chemotaxis family, protein-glutamate methylesterase/glutaminase